jgi:hypothetical protein
LASTGAGGVAWLQQSAFGSGAGFGGGLDPQQDSSSGFMG